MSPVGEVPVAVLQRAFQDSGYSAAQVARAMGWVRVKSGRSGSSGDTTKFQRAIGLKPNSRHPTGRRYTQQGTSYDRATELIRAMDLDPVDYGL